MEEIRLNNADWLVLFFKKSRLSPFWLAFVLLIINLLVDLFLALLFGGLFRGARSHGLINEPIAFTSDLLVPSVLIGYYCWIQTAIPQVIQTLINEKIISLDDETRQLIERASSYMRSKLLTRIILLISIGASFSFALSVPMSNPIYVGWVVVNPVIPWVRSFFNVLSIYTGCMFIIDVAILTYLLAKIFNGQSIKVKPSHPDNCGGLGVIGRFTSNMSYLIGVFGILVSISLLSNTMPAGIDSIKVYYLTKVGALIVYLLAAPVLFFVPLISAHLAMQKFRYTFLFDLGKEIDDEYAIIQESRSQLSADELDQKTKRINYYRELYLQAHDFPVWPFYSQNFRSFFIFVSGTVLPGVMSVAFDVVGFFIKK